MICFRRFRSAPFEIFRLMPPPCDVFGHQHAIAAGEAQIGGERRALVAALFLDDLDQQHLTAADHVLDLVAAAQI
jgi:hypothetical protein